MNSNLYNIIPTVPCQALHLTFERIATSEGLKAGRTGVRCSSDGSHQLVELLGKRVLHGGHHRMVSRIMRPAVCDARRVSSLHYGYSLALPWLLAREYSASAPRCEPTDPRAILWQLRSGGSLSVGPIVGDDGLYLDAKREPKTEAWYRYFLNIKVRPKPYKPHQELLRQVAGALKTPLPQNLMPKPNSVFETKQNLDIGKVRDCVILHIHQRNRGDKASAREAFKKDPVGIRCLSWMLEQNTVEPFMDQRLCDAVSFILVAEQEADSLWKLIQLPDLPAFAQAVGLEPGFRRFWRPSFLIKLIESNGYWTHHHNACVSMLSTLRNALDLPRGRTPPVVVPAKFVAKHLIMADKADVDTADYDALLEFLDRARKDIPEPVLDYNIAALRLTHPTRPDPQVLLDLCRATGRHRTYEASVPEQMLKSGQWRAATTAYFLLVLLAQVCEAQGMYDEARWALSWGYDQHPDQFSARPPKGTYDNRLIEPLPRKATEKGVARGVQVDEEGYVVRSARMMDWYAQSRNQ